MGKKDDPRWAIKGVDVEGEPVVWWLAGGYRSSPDWSERHMFDDKQLASSVLRWWEKQSRKDPDHCYTRWFLVRVWTNGK